MFHCKTTPSKRFLSRHINHLSHFCLVYLAWQQLFSLKIKKLASLLRAIVQLPMLLLLAAWTICSFSHERLPPALVSVVLFLIWHTSDGNQIFQVVSARLEDDSSLMCSLSIASEPLIMSWFSARTANLIKRFKSWLAILGPSEKKPPCSSPVRCWLGTFLESQSFDF